MRTAQLTRGQGRGLPVSGRGAFTRCGNRVKKSASRPFATSTPDARRWITTPCREAASPPTNATDKTPSRLRPLASLASGYDRKPPLPQCPAMNSAQNSGPAGAGRLPQASASCGRVDLVVVAGPFSTKWGRCRRRRRMGCGEQESVAESLAMTVVQCDSWFRKRTIRRPAPRISVRRPCRLPAVGAVGKGSRL